jgi:phytoene dehydrogenase-like protein
MPDRWDAVVIGSGPNGFAAAITLARAGLSVLLLEAAGRFGGGLRSAELTLPGFLHDICSAVHPLAVSSPFFETLPLGDFGLRWIHPDAPLAHPTAGGGVILLERSVDRTADNLGPDASAYRKLMGPLASGWSSLRETILAPPRLPLRRPLALARFGLHAIRSAAALARSIFSGERARALFAGLAAHSTLALEERPSAAFGLVLGAAAHAVGWPIARGGSQRLADALAGCFEFLGGKMQTGVQVRSVDDLPPARIVLCDIGPGQLLQIAGHRFPGRFRRKLERYRYGPGAYKIDWALSGPIPWKAPYCARAATVHLGGTFDEIAASERAARSGLHAERPFVILVQPTLFDSTRAPRGSHTAWAYCHVPNGSNFDMTSRIEAQVERFAPGFRDCIMARSVRPPALLEEYNPNLVGGDVNGGLPDLRQLFTRPTVRLYSTPAAGIYLCSASTPPGGGVHGMCGHFAARAALSWLEG